MTGVISAQATRKKITAVLQGVSQKQKGNKPVHEYEVKRPGMQYPDFITLWDERWSGDFPALRVGETYTFLVDAKPRGEGKKGEYWDFVEATTQAEPTPEDQTQPTQQQEYWKPRDPAERTSIERQVALKAAVDYMSHLVTAGQKDFHTSHVVNAAEIFAAFIARGEVPQPKSAPAQAQPTPQSVSRPAPPAPIGQGETPQFRNRGDLFTAARNRWQATPQHIYELLGVKKVDEITDFVGAWKKMCQAWDQQPEQAQDQIFPPEGGQEQ